MNVFIKRSLCETKNVSKYELMIFRLRFPTVISSAFCKFWQITDSQREFNDVIWRPSYVFSPLMLKYK